MPVLACRVYLVAPQRRKGPPRFGVSSEVFLNESDAESRAFIMARALEAKGADQYKSVSILMLCNDRFGGEGIYQRVTSMPLKFSTPTT